jgi:hypothetical protein
MASNANSTAALGGAKVEQNSRLLIESEVVVEGRAGLRFLLREVAVAHATLTAWKSSDRGPRQSEQVDRFSG